LKNTERSELSREAILAAAIDTLQTLGYHRFRTADVAKRSGLSEGTLFYYYPTKNALIAGATERVLAEYVERGVTAYGSLSQPIDRRRMLELLWEVLSDSRLNWTHELFSAVRSDPRLREALGPVIIASARRIDEVAFTVMQAIGGVPDDECRDTADIVIWAMQGLISRDMARGPSGLEGELIDYVVFLVDVMYPAPSAGSST
jgi:AcrR family transcriptional regulator